MSLKILVVTPDFPYPANHGGRVDYYNRIRCFQEFGYEVDLISTVKEEIGEEHIGHMRRYVKSVTLVRRDISIRSLLSGLPLQMKSREGLKKISLSEKTYDVLWLESEYVLPIIENPDFKFKKSFLRIHNLESRYFVSLATSSMPHPSALFYFLEAYKFRRFNKRFSFSIDKRLYISSSEMKAAAGNYNNFYLPPVYPEFKIQTALQKREGKRVLFVGSLFMPNNRKSIDFFIQQVHPLLLTHQEYEFVIIGSTRMDAALQQKLNAAYAGAANVRFLFDASDETILEYYSSSRVFVNPVFETAGIKMKVLDAIRHGIPVVSTNAGIEGTGLDAGQDVLIADSAKEMASQIKAIFSGSLDGFSLVRNAQIKLQSNQTKLKQVFYE